MTNVGLLSKVALLYSIQVTMTMGTDMYNVNVNINVEGNIHAVSVVIVHYYMMHINKIFDLTIGIPEV